jgi:hypothetical protein
MTRWSAQAGAGVVGLLFGLLLFEPLVSWIAPQRLALKTFSVIGARRIAAEELVRASGVTAGSSVHVLDPAAVSERLAAHPWISEARVTTFLSRKLLVAIVERETAAIAEIGTPPTAWLVDAGGTPFATATAIDSEIHPTLVGVEDAEPGRPNPRLAQGVQIARAVDRRGLPAVRRVRLGGADAGSLPELWIGTRGRRVVLGGGELQAKLDRLSWVLQADLEGIETVSSIDLRFGSGVVLRSGPPPSGGETTEPRGGAGPSNSGRAG